ncbi:MAG: hypothetical protein V1705_02475 [bacterium]
MKKIFSTLVLVSLFGILLAPAVVSAGISGPQECCVLRRAIQINGATDPAGTAISNGVFAKDKSVGPTAEAAGECGTDVQASPQWGIVCTMNTLNGVIDWIFVILLGTAGIFVIIGGMMILISGGSSEKINQGRDFILYSLVGIAVAFLARAIPSIARLIIGA